MLRPRHATFLLQEKNRLASMCVYLPILTLHPFFFVSILFVYIFVYTRLLGRFNSPYHVSRVLHLLDTTYLVPVAAYQGVCI